MQLDVQTINDALHHKMYPTKSLNCLGYSGIWRKIVKVQGMLKV